MDDAGFRGRYGPWAVVAGASDGVGAAIAMALAERGVDVVLLARRQAVLDEMATSIAAATGVRTRVVAVDLAEPGAAACVAAAAEDLEIGFLAYCAGADPAYAPFLDQAVETALAMVQRNCTVPLELCHHFAAPMVIRGRGGIVIVGSGAALVGAPNMVAYGASKAFDLVMGEALWAELHERGVDVLNLVLGVTDTPALRRLLAERGVMADPSDDLPIPGASTPADVVDDLLTHLDEGPTWFVGEMARAGASTLGSMERGDAVRLMIEHGGAVMEPSGGGPS